MRDDVLSNMPAEVARNRIASRKQVSAITGLSACQVDRLVKAGRFPPPFKIGLRKTGWRIGTVLDHLERAEAAAA